MAASVMNSQSFHMAKNRGCSDYSHGQSVVFYDNGCFDYQYFQNVLLWSNSGKPFDKQRYKTFKPLVTVDIADNNLPTHELLDLIIDFQHRSNFKKVMHEIQIPNDFEEFGEVEAKLVSPDDLKRNQKQMEDSLIHNDDLLLDWTFDEPESPSKKQKTLNDDKESKSDLPKVRKVNELSQLRKEEIAQSFLPDHIQKKAKYQQNRKKNTKKKTNKHKKKR